MTRYTFDKWLNIFSGEDLIEEMTLEEQFDSWLMSGDLPPMDGDLSGFNDEMKAFIREAEVLDDFPERNLYWHYGTDHIAICIRFESLPIACDPCLRFATVEDARLWLKREFVPPMDHGYFWPNADGYLTYQKER